MFVFIWAKQDCRGRRNNSWRTLFSLLVKLGYFFAFIQFKVFARINFTTRALVAFSLPLYGAHSLHHYCRLSSLFSVCSTFAHHYRCESLLILTWLNNEASPCELEDRQREFSDFRFRFLWGIRKRKLVSMCMCAPLIEHRPHAALEWRRQWVDGSRLLNNEPLFFIIMAAKAKSVRATKRVGRMIKRVRREFKISEHKGSFHIR